MAVVDDARDGDADLVIAALPVGDGVEQGLQPFGRIADPGRRHPVRFENGLVVHQRRQHLRAAEVDRKGGLCLCHNR
ncbi:hypothetical protein D3C72_1666600 [compost metagenome]